jgi:hypothetical protein
VRRIARVVDGRRVTFLANPSAEPIEVDVRASDPSVALVAWDPIEVRAVPLRRADPSSGDRTEHRLSLPPFGSVFVLDSTRRLPEASVADTIVLEGEWQLSLPGRPRIGLAPRPRLWTDLDAHARGFSGIGTYRIAVPLTAEQLDADRLGLDLGVVRDIARVTVNGMECGIAWTAPFRVDATAALRAGDNVVEIEVATPWRNRLIAEAEAPTGAIFAPMTEVFEPTAEPLPAGLEGPVELFAESRR